MKKLFAFSISLLLATVAFVLTLPVLLSAYLLATANKISCWGQKHDFDPSQFILGIKIDSLRCKRCGASMPDRDKPAFMAKVNKSLENLEANKRILDELFKKRDEEAIDELLSEGGEAAEH